MLGGALSVTYVSTHGHWDCTTRRAWAEAEGCTVVQKGGTISMPTGRHVDNNFIPDLKTETEF